MFNAAKSAIRPPKIQRTSIMDFLKGYQSTMDTDRGPNNSLKISSNVQIEQNGTIRPRPSLCRYGTQPPGTVLGSIYPFVDSTSGVPINKLICVCNVSGTAKVYISADGGAWTRCDGKSYDVAAHCRFEQIDNNVLVMNGTDNLSYYECGGTTVVPFTSLTTPTITSVTGAAGLVSGSPSIPLQYRVSAVNQGETAGSTDSPILVNTVRSQWNQGGRSGDEATIVWPRVSGAQYYNVYVGDTAGLEYYLDTIQDPGTGTTVTYVDNNTLALNTNRIAPNGDSTAGPRVKWATNVLGQVFMTGDADNPYRVWFGGFGSTALDFSAFDGGGWVEIDKGGRYFPTTIHGFRDGHGNAVATCLMQGSSGRGKVVHVAMTSTTVDNTILTYAQLEEGNGQDGTVSPDAVIYANDSLWYPSKTAFKRTGTNPDLLNILSTQSFTDQIIPDVESLNILQMASAVGIEYQGRLYFFLPVGSTKNNQAWVCDLNRGGLWTNPWDVSVDWAWLYDDSSGVTHFMALSNNVIYEFSYNQLTTDDATAFPVDIASGLIKFAPDGVEWANVIDITFVFERPQGTINLAVTGKTLDSDLNNLGSATYTPDSTVVGWDEGAWSDGAHYWDSVVTVPTITGEERVEETIEIDDQMPYLSWEVTSDSMGVDFQLADVIVRSVDVGVIGLSDS